MRKRLNGWLLLGLTVGAAGLRSTSVVRLSPNDAGRSLAPTTAIVRGSSIAARRAPESTGSRPVTAVTVG